MFMNIMTCDRRVDRYTPFNRNRAVTRFCQSPIFYILLIIIVILLFFTAYLSLSVPLIALTK